MSIILGMECRHEQAGGKDTLLTSALLVACTNRRTLALGLYMLAVCIERRAKCRVVHYLRADGSSTSAKDSKPERMKVTVHRKASRLSTPGDGVSTCQMSDGP